ncbi:MAG: hypothetical protein FWG71_03735 [Synergistaceae bacterium]|nr:hypothetical protein [Synergistaceae bacterium]
MVELLIVIVIIGILAAAMLLSSGSATDSAEASNIISDMRSLKSAALLLHADSMDDNSPGGYQSTGPTLGAIVRYADNAQKYLADDSGWEVVRIPAAGGDWHIRRHLDVAGNSVSSGAKARLSSRAANVGLVNNAGETYNNHPYVAMKIR